MRDRLIELLNEADNKFGCFNAFCTERATEEAKNELLDYLLKNGVVVPPCKVGDTVYQVDTLFEEIIIAELKVIELTIDNKGIKTLYGATSRGSIYCFSRDYNLSNIKFTKEAEKHLGGVQE